MSGSRTFRSTNFPAFTIRHRESLRTANGRITPDGYPNSISMEWEAPWRTARIYHVLESGRQFSAADMLALQTDIHSEADLFAAERFVYAVDHASKPSAEPNRQRI